MNAEFEKFVWTELTTQRVSALIATLLICLLVAFFSGGFEGMLELSVGAVFVLGILLGTGKVSHSVSDELIAGTWDWKRLSSVSAVSIVAGKLWGAPILSWIGVGFCFFAWALSSVLTFGSGSSNYGLYLLLAICIISLTHAVVLLLEIFSATRGRSPERLGIIIQIFSFVGLLWFLSVVHITARTDHEPAALLTWYGFQFSVATFTLASVIIFFAWAFIGCCRTLQKQLSFDQYPVFFLLFLIFLWAYSYGFLWSMTAFVSELAVPVHDYKVGFALGNTIFLSAVYFMLLVEPASPSTLLRFIDLLKRGEMSKSFMFIPLWALSLVLAIVTIPIFFFQVQDAKILQFSHFILGTTLLGIRDSALFTYARLVPRKRRIDWLFMFSLLLLYFLLPIFCAVFFGQIISPLFFPDGSRLSSILLGIQALLAAVCAVSALQASCKKEES